MSELGADKPRRGRERRRHHRRNVVDRQMVTVELGTGRTGILIDLSETGMAVQPFLPVPAGTELDFHFDLPRGAGRVVGKGTVSSAARTGRIGVQFNQLSESSVTHVREWLKVTRDPFATSQPELPGTALAQPAIAPGLNDELDLDTALEMIADRARSVTRADGAAVIVAAEYGFACRASSGRAPARGTPAAADASLTGECLRLGVPVNCGDTATDPRVNAMACERLNLRSVLVVPVLIDGRIFGALEVLSSVAGRFTDKEVTRLEQLADIASGVLVSNDAHPEVRNN